MLNRLRFLTLVMGILLAWGCAKASTSGSGLAPRTDWRLAPVAVVASQNADQLAGLSGKTTAEWTVSYPGDPWLAVRVPDGLEGPAMLTFSYPEQPTSVAVEAAFSHDSTDGSDGTWKAAAPRQLGKRLEKVVLDPADGTWLRVRLLRLDKSLRPAEFTLTNVGLYELSETELNDYWVVLGASIQAQSIRQDTFHAMVAERYPDYDPVIFNTAVSGWTTTNLLNKLPEILADHPHASYCVIHIGGNNVSGGRPYPGGAERLESELVQILEMVQAAGKTPILSRLSYRAYKEGNGRPGVPPEENGSGPYVENVFDPLIAQYCPLFYDETTGRGVVDAYTWFKEHPEELSGDGIHVNSEGARSWNRLWAEHAGAVVYGRD